MQTEIVTSSGIQKPVLRVEQAMYLRLETTDNKPYLQGISAGELVITALVNGQQNGEFEVIGFVVMPTELQLLCVPKRLNARQIGEYIEAEIYPYLSALTWIPGTVFDTELYQEKIECREDFNLRKRLMLNAPAKAGLVTMGTPYLFTSANSRYRDMLSPVM